jgi:hypothetical protein
MELDEFGHGDSSRATSLVPSGLRKAGKPASQTACDDHLIPRKAARPIGASLGVSRCPPPADKENNTRHSSFPEIVATLQGSGQWPSIFKRGWPRTDASLVKSRKRNFIFSN